MARNHRPTQASEKPIYAQIVGALHREIDAGVYAVGDLLPTESALCTRFGVSRHTVREALRVLRDDGLIESRQGAGSRVLAPSTKPIYTYAVTSIEELLQFATEARYQINKSAIVAADPVLAKKLDCKTGARWLRVEGFRARVGEDLPLCWTEVFIAGDFAGIGLLIGRKQGTVYSFIEEMYGVRVEQVEQTLESCPMPEPAWAEMGVASDAQAMLLRRAYRLTDGVTALVVFNYHDPRRLKLSWALKRGG
jgi:DNA-binding GntR family transcriptional regulator